MKANVRDGWIIGLAVTYTRRETFVTVASEFVRGWMVASSIDTVGRARGVTTDWFCSPRCTMPNATLLLVWLGRVYSSPFLRAFEFFQLEIPRLSPDASVSWDVFGAAASRHSLKLYLFWFGGEEGVDSGLIGRTCDCVRLNVNGCSGSSSPPPRAHSFSRLTINCLGRVSRPAE